MVGIEVESGLAALLLTKAIEAFDRGLAMRPVFPFTGCTPLELCSHRSFRERFPRSDQRLDIHAIIHRSNCIGHNHPSVLLMLELCTAITQPLQDKLAYNEQPI